MATTTNFGWNTPDNTGYVKDGALAIRTLGTAIDASMAPLRGGTTDQVLKKASGSNMDFVWGTVSSTPRIGQVVQTFSTGSSTTSTTSGTWVDASGHSVTITPTLSTSKVLVTMNFIMQISSFGTSGIQFGSKLRILRGSTAVYDAGTPYFRTPSGTNYTVEQSKVTLSFMDSPATTSATTYKLQFQPITDDITVIGYSDSSIIAQEVLV